MTDKKILSIRTEGDFGADFFAPGLIFVDKSEKSFIIKNNVA